MKCFIMILIFSPFILHASQLTNFGIGAKNQALVNSASSLSLDAYSQIYNPATLSFVNKKQFSTSLQGAITFFEKINQVLTDTVSLGGASNTTSDVVTKTPDTFTLSVAYSQPFNEKVFFGLFINSPIEKILSVDTQDSFLPQYSMYLSDTQRFSGGLNFAYKINDTLSLGVGGQLYLVTASTARFRLPAGGNATSRLRMDVRPGIAPSIGLTKRFGDFNKTSVIFWGKQDYRFILENNTTLSLIAPTDLIFAGRSSIAYDPDTFIISHSYQDDKDTVSVGAHLERWSDFTGTTMNLSFQTFTGTFAQNLQASKFRDTISLRAGYMHHYGSWDLMLGYGFVPTPVPDQNGDSNYLDSDKHVMGLGLSLFKKALDLAMQVHYLVPKQIAKSSNAYIGAPGYKIGGFVVSYGLTWVAEF